MHNYSESIERTFSAAKRVLVILIFFAAVFVFSVFGTFAEDGTVLTVSKDGEVVKEFTQDELEQIAEEEGDKTYVYSAFNTYPSFKEYTDVKGPTVFAVLRKAGVKEDITDTDTVSFTDGSYKASFTGYQLTKEQRYYFPNGRLADPVKGTVPPEAYEDAAVVEPVIHLTGDKDKKNVLCVGQAAPNDENNPIFVQCLKIIEVKSGSAAQCTIPEADPANKSVCKKGQKISFKGTGRAHEYIYYTLDGSEPDYGSTIYNSGMQQGTVTNPVLPKKYGKYKIKVKVKAYGRQDSKTATFTYYVGPGKPEVTLKAGKKQVKVSWKKIKDADGYVVYRSTKKSSGFKAVKTIKKGSTVSYTNKKLKKGKRYYYKVRAYVNVSGEKVFSKYSSVKSAKAK